MHPAAIKAPQWGIERGSAAYPARLFDLDAPERPALIYGAGRPEALARLAAEPAVTIVGSRQASGYGLRVAERFAHDLAAAGVPIVSGMARGIDAAAHRGALAGGGTTVAVLACGPDVVYPPSHRALYEQIVATGAVISERPPGSTAQRHHFPERNRIMAALAEVVVIVEAAQPSGTLITADIAAKLGRTVAAIPGQLGVRVAAGANDLLKDGAHLVRDARDVLDLLFGVGADARPGELREAPRPRPGPSLEPQLRAVLDLVTAGATTVDGAAIASGLSPREVAVALARLELLGYVTADALGGYAPTALDPP